jgi:gamma-glutamylcyclotransferase (GGCT)/AIG2-like uncharacterized protein YtfP
MLYFAYGMNTDRAGMAQRCPGALSLGHARLVNHVFRFAVHADVMPCDNSWVEGVLWVIDQQHLNSLDRVEGYPWYYDRTELQVEHCGLTVTAHCYRMQPGNADAPPTQNYLDAVIRGYREHSVPAEQLYNSLYIL